MKLKSRSVSKVEEQKKVIILGPNRKSFIHQVSRINPKENISVFTWVRPKGVDVHFNYSIQSREVELRMGKTLDLEISALSQELLYKQQLLKQRKAQEKSYQNSRQKPQKVSSDTSKLSTEYCFPQSSDIFSNPLSQLDQKIMNMINLCTSQ